MSKRKDAPDGICIYRKSWETLLMFSENEAYAGRLMLAVGNYFINGEEPVFEKSDLALKIAFTQFQNDIEYGWKKFQDKCESARNRKSPTQTDRIRENPTETVNDREKPNDSDFDGMSGNLTVNDRVNLPESVIEDIVTTETESDRQEPTESVCEEEKEKSQSVDQSVRKDGGSGVTEDGQTFSTPQEIETAWRRLFIRSMSMQDQLAIQDFLSDGYSVDQIVTIMRKAGDANSEIRSPIAYLRKALQEQGKPIIAKSESGKASERGKEIERRFYEYLESTHI